MARGKYRIRARYGHGMGLWWMFPKATIAAHVLRGLGKATAGVVRVLWPFRRELAVITAVCWIWQLVADWMAGWASLLVTAALVGLVLGVAPLRRPVLGWLAGGRTRRQLLAGLVQVRATDLNGRAPRVVRVRPTPIGQRLWLRLRPGQSAEAILTRVPELRAAVHSRDVRLARDEARSDRVTVDVVRRDPLSVSEVVPWLDRDKDALSLWDPVHWGVSELGTTVRLSLVERAVLIGGNRGAGKSSGINVLVAHAAKSPDAELLLIDANRLQLAPWRDRALCFADHRVDDAIDVVRRWRDEIDRRLALLESVPGVPLGLTRALSAEHGLPLWLLVIDELAYHTSVAGTGVQQREFSTVLRDGVARGRAAGCGVVVATQRPTHDLIPTSLRDLFDIRIAYRTMTTVSSDVILGDGFAKAGYCATDIDLTARGVAWLFAEGRAPVRTKTTWIPAELRAELAVTTVRYRPSLRGFSAAHTFPTTLPVDPEEGTG